MIICIDYRMQKIDKNFPGVQPICKAPIDHYRGEGSSCWSSNQAFFTLTHQPGPNPTKKDFPGWAECTHGQVLVETKFF